MFCREGRWIVRIVALVTLGSFVLVFVGPPVLRSLGVYHAARPTRDERPRRKVRPGRHPLEQQKNDAWAHTEPVR